MEFDDQIQNINEYLASGMEEIMQRIGRLERERGLSPLGFGAGATWSDPAQRVAALIALAQWRVSRLESLHEVN